ncbi:uncharacterized protein LOC142319992 [Lycorma delicatula]|uniref:uncharacterized protein LOC142319992 n=1 Tax=Lycorma delicatula TaxID=130591 RepID=UPI003F50FA76
MVYTAWVIIQEDYYTGDEQLIYLVRRYDAIYSIKCIEYRDARLRNAAWEEITKIHDAECKENWNKFCNCYNNAMKRRQKKKFSRNQAKKKGWMTDYFFKYSKMVKELPKLDQIRIKVDLHKALSEAELKQLEPQQNILRTPITIKSDKQL